MCIFCWFTRGFPCRRLPFALLLLPCSPGKACLSVTSQLFPELIEWLGLAGTFGIHLFCCVCCMAFLHFCLVETKVRPCCMATLFMLGGAPGIWPR